MFTQKRRKPLDAEQAMTFEEWHELSCPYRWCMCYRNDNAGHVAECAANQKAWRRCARPDWRRRMLKERLPAEVHTCRWYFDNGYAVGDGMTYSEFTEH